MKFKVRSVRSSDIHGLHDLATQFSLLNLPGDRKILTNKIDRSIESFNGKRTRAEAEYLFVLQDLESDFIAGSSLIIAKHGTENVPHYFFRIVKKNMFSQDLGIGFIHQVLQFQEDSNGPTEIGGLLIDRDYRRRPEKLGKQISLSRFLYMGMFPEEFESRVLCELTPPLSEGARSEFWEALGRRFTGLPYQEADIISQQNKEFISSLFPQEDIYLALLDSKARLVMGRVGPDTKPAQHLLESIGFRYLNEVDPFDGGPHYGANIKDISIVKNSRWLKVGSTVRPQFSDQGLVGIKRDGEFNMVMCALERLDDELFIPETAKRALELDQGEKVFFSPI